LPQPQWTFQRVLLHSKPCCAALVEAWLALFGLSHCPQSGSFEPDPDIAITLLLLSGLLVGFNWLFVGCFSACIVFILLLVVLSLFMKDLLQKKKKL
jgi:hypothetical protein